MTRWDVETVKDLLLQAGRLALEHFDAPKTEHKADTSLVTVADRSIEEFLCSRLADGSDTAMMLGEESADAWTQAGVDAALRGTTWIVDPIDGTAPYANQLPTWGVSVGLMEGGRLTNGALFLPRTGEMFITSGDAVLFHRGARNPEYWSFTLEAMPRNDRSYTSTGMVSLPQEIRHGGRFGGRNPIQSNGSAVYSVAKLIRGSYLCYIARIKLWDLAGSIPILERLGYRMVFDDGHQLSSAVSSQDWVLDAASPRLWKSAGLVFLAPDDETVRYMREHYQPA